jgi:hypothetical protein
MKPVRRPVRPVPAPEPEALKGEPGEPGPAGPPGVVDPSLVETIVRDVVSQLPPPEPIIVQTPAPEVIMPPRSYQTSVTPIYNAQGMVTGAIHEFDNGDILESTVHLAGGPLGPRSVKSFTFRKVGG